MQEPEQTDDEQWVDIARFPTLDEAQENALVALAMGQAIRVENGDIPGEFDLQADVNAAPRISDELREYAAESDAKIVPPLLPSGWAKHPAGILPLLLWAAALLLVFYFQIQDPSISDRGASSSIALLEKGEWWRPFTALFLHGDGPHIVGNLASGAVFGMLVSKSIGPWKGWAMILLSGAAGNAITSWVTYPEPFVSLGASTAVFGALGILSGSGIVENIRENIAHPWIRTLAPVIAGIVLLGWLGGGAPGSNTDVLGHVFGFSAGILCGAGCRYCASGDPSRL